MRFYPVRLRGPRVVVREIDPVADVAAAFRFASDPAFFRYTAAQPVSSEAEEAEALKAIAANAHEDPRVQYQLGIALASDLVGIVRLGITSFELREADLGYGLRRDAWGRGLATESAALVVDFGFRTLGLHRIVAYHDPENDASARVLARLGMQTEGRLRDNTRSQSGGWRDCVVAAVLEHEWQSPFAQA